MKLSKLGLWLLVAYLVWAAFWYFGYRGCLTYPQGGQWINGFGCELSLGMVSFPLGVVLYWISPRFSIDAATTPEQLLLRVFIAFLFSRVFYYALGAWIDWLGQPQPPPAGQRDDQW